MENGERRFSPGDPIPLYYYCVLIGGYAECQQFMRVLQLSCRVAPLALLPAVLGLHAPNPLKCSNVQVDGQAYDLSSLDK